MKFRCAGITDSCIDGLEYSPALCIFFQGCHMGCFQCHNPELQSFHNGTEMDTSEVVNYINNSLDKYSSYYKGTVLSGGNPTDQPIALYEIITQIDVPKVLYTGDKFENVDKRILDNVNIIVDGPYQHNLRTNDFPASKNQRCFKKIDGIWSRFI